MAKSSATSRRSWRARATNRSKSASVPSSGFTAVWPPSAPPMAHTLPGSPGCAVSVLLRPLRWVRPTGWIGGRYTTSKPSEAARSSIASASLNVAWRPGTPRQQGAKGSGHGLVGDRHGAAGVGGDRPPPAIVVDEAHRRFAPGRLPRPPVLQDGDDDVMAFLEDVGLHVDDIANLTLDGVAAAVDGGSHVLDDDGAPEVAPHSGLPSHVSRDRCRYHRSTR